MVYFQFTININLLFSLFHYLGICRSPFGPSAFLEVPSICVQYYSFWQVICVKGQCSPRPLYLFRTSVLFASSPEFLSEIWISRTWPSLSVFECFYYFFLDLLKYIIYCTKFTFQDISIASIQGVQVFSLSSLGRFITSKSGIFYTQKGICNTWRF